MWDKYLKKRRQKTNISLAKFVRRSPEHEQLFICCRWSEGPKVKGLEPIVVIFLEKRDKEAVWLKIRQEENLINQLSYPGMDPPPPLPPLNWWGSLPVLLVLITGKRLHKLGWRREAYNRLYWKLQKVYSTARPAQLNVPSNSNSCCMDIAFVLNQKSSLKSQQSNRVTDLFIIPCCLLIGCWGKPYRDRICKRLRSQESTIPPAYLAWRAGTAYKIVVTALQAGNRFLGSLKGLQKRAQGLSTKSSLPG